MLLTWKLVVVVVQVLLVLLGLNAQVAEARLKTRPRWDDVHDFAREEARLKQLLNEFEALRPSLQTPKLSFSPRSTQSLATEPLPWPSALKAAESSLTRDEEDAGDEQEDSRPPTFVDLCREKRCGAGRECEVDAVSNVAECVCVAHCGPDADPRRQVCSNLNETFATDCHLYKERCECEEKMDKCQDNRHKHQHIDYYGSCRELASCKADELADFPRRMREWLFNVMHELAQRGELSDHFSAMETEANTADNQRLKWRNAAIWKWCALNALHNPLDNAVSRHELFPVKAPLKALEHCIGDFLDTCDSDSDHLITLQEWGECLELEEDELVARCEVLNN